MTLIRQRWFYLLAGLLLGRGRKARAVKPVQVAPQPVRMVAVDPAPDELDFVEAVRHRLIHVHSFRPYHATQWSEQYAPALAPVLGMTADKAAAYIAAERKQQIQDWYLSKEEVDEHRAKVQAKKDRFRIHQ